MMKMLWQVLARRHFVFCLAGCVCLVAMGGARTILLAEDSTATATTDPAAVAHDEASMKPYTQVVSGTPVKFDLVPIKGGKFLMGSPVGEAGRKEDEGPQHEVEIAPFWMGKCEVTWGEYEIFMFSLDIQRRKVESGTATEFDKLADAVTRPTKPYTDMTFGMGKEGFPAICMTQLAAKTYCEWLSAKTGHYYRLPTEAEWEYACRAGTTTVYSFGDDADQLGDYAWYYDNANEAYHPVGKKKPNPWGLHDMHGNVAEWCVDQYVPDFYAKSAGTLAANPLAVASRVEPRSVRGGSWDDDPTALRSATRRASTKEWKQQDPQIPQSIWYYTDALFLGFRVVRPLVEPPAAEKVKYAPDASQK
ncbi:MAG TPA: SUMF1/EgtB/PvdO family nonheme iron enzyme [Pirellulales bacterium]|jgi:formylglycine-generating enzyme required for sulfatase activity